jgi:hypothetical protein
MPLASVLPLCDGARKVKRMIRIETPISAGLTHERLVGRRPRAKEPAESVSSPSSDSQSCE